MQLMSHFLLSYHHVYADNYLTSVFLAEDLLQADTYLCGTIRPSRRAYPNSLAGAVVCQGESVKWRNECGVMLIKWRDKRDVFLIATNDDGKDHVKQTRRHRQQIELSVPECVRKYNLSMGGVDRLDQFRSYYGVGRSGRRWWKYVFWGVLNIAVINAYIIWLACNRPLPSNARAFSLKTFKVKLVHDLVDQFTAAHNYAAPPVVVRPTVAYTVDDATVEGHAHVRFEGRKRMCHVCHEMRVKTSSGGNIETSFGCTVCNVRLCKGGRCFGQ